MTAVPILLANAVAAELNAAVADVASPIKGFTANRSYADWDLDYKDLDDLTVDVVFRTNSDSGAMTMSNFGEVCHTSQIHVAVRKRFEPTDREESSGRLKNSSVDPLVKLLQDVHEHFVKLRNTGALPTYNQARWSDAEVISWVNQKRLRQSHFEGVVELEFKVWRPV